MSDNFPIVLTRNTKLKAESSPTLEKFTGLGKNGNAVVNVRPIRAVSEAEVIPRGPIPDASW